MRVRYMRLPKNIASVVAAATVRLPHAVADYKAHVHLAACSKPFQNDRETVHPMQPMYEHDVLASPNLVRMNAPVPLDRYLPLACFLFLPSNVFALDIVIQPG